MQTQPAHLNSDNVPGIKMNTTSTAWGDASSAISFTCRRPHRSWRVRSALPFLTCVHVPGNKVNTTSAEWGDGGGAISISYCRPRQLSHVCFPPHYLSLPAYIRKQSGFCVCTCGVYEDTVPHSGCKLVTWTGAFPRQCPIPS